MLPSCVETFFSSAPGGAILSMMVRPSRAAAVKDGRLIGRPKGLSLTGKSTAAGWCAPATTLTA
jgi:hypothetical protein